jgi:hypothetical protein
MAKKRIERPSAPLTSGKQGVKYESTCFGCYDKKMNPHPTWNVPKTYPTRKIGYENRNLKETPILPVYYIGSRPETVMVQGSGKRMKKTTIQRMVFTAKYHPYPNFIIPTEIMSTGVSSAKLAKNKRPSIVLYMSPVKRNSFGIDACPLASAACEAVCLDYSGQKVGQQKQRMAIARTDMYFAHRELFWERIYKEIEKGRAGAIKKGFEEFAVRLNGTSDINLFEEFMVWCIENGKTLGKGLVFYDYTKIVKNVTYDKSGEYINFYNENHPNRNKPNFWPIRHKVTFSLSEDVKKNKNAYKAAAEVLLRGGTVAAVFLVDPKGSPTPTGNKRVELDLDGELKYYAPLPENLVFDYEGKRYSVPILDGDMSDDLMLDEGSGGKVLGLRAKQRAQYDTSGFALPVFALRNEGQFDEVLEDVYIELDVNKRTIMAACGLEKPSGMMFECMSKDAKDTIVLDDNHLFNCKPIGSTY